MTMTAERRAEVKKQYRRHDTDSGSPELQIALLTERINGLSEHLKGSDQQKGHVKDHHGRRGLMLMVNKRNRLLAYLARTNPQAYQSLIGRLGLRK